jgi:hypothetical protein
MTAASSGTAALLVDQALAGDALLATLTERLRQRGALVVVLTEAVRPRVVLAACRGQGAAPDRSWLATPDPGALAAAATAGLAGVVLIGADPPAGEHALVVARAEDLADAPRVMVPRGGGCWHDPSR